MTAQETLELFIEKLKDKDIKYVDILPLVTKTQQEYSEYVGKPPIHNHLIGLYTLINKCKKITVREKPGSNLLAKDFTVVFNAEKKFKFSCRLIKESGFQKPSEDGEWGVNVSSFKLLNK